MGYKMAVKAQIYVYGSSLYRCGGLQAVDLGQPLLAAPRVLCLAALHLHPDGGDALLVLRLQGACSLCLF